MKSSFESKKRGVVKTITFRTIATFTTFGLVLLFTGELTIAVSLSIVEFFSKIIVYYIHERIWSKVVWGIE